MTLRLPLFISGLLLFSITSSQAVDITNQNWVVLTNSDLYPYISVRDRFWWNGHPSEAVTQLSNSSVAASSVNGLYSTSTQYPAAANNWLHFRYPLDGDASKANDFEVGHFRMLFANKSNVAQKMRVGLSRGLLNNGTPLDLEYRLNNLALWVESPGTGPAVDSTVHFTTGPSQNNCNASLYNTTQLQVKNAGLTGDYHLVIFNVQQVDNTTSNWPPNHIQVRVFVFRAQTPNELVVADDSQLSSKLMYQTFPDNPVILGHWPTCVPGNLYRLTPMASLAAGNSTNAHFLLGFQRKKGNLFDADFRPD